MRRSTGLAGGVVSAQARSGRAQVCRRRRAHPLPTSRAWRAGTSSFLPNAEPQDLTALTQFVILTALHDWQELSKSGFNLKFAVNAPIASLTDLNLPDLIRANTPKDGNWPGLILEVTEGEVAKDIGLAHEIATQLSIYGISLSIDDFGEGYSSFARLRDLPFAELKLDASFVKNCVPGPQERGDLPSCHRACPQLWGACGGRRPGNRGRRAGGAADGLRHRPGLRVCPPDAQRAVHRGASQARRADGATCSAVATRANA